MSRNLQETYHSQQAGWRSFNDGHIVSYDTASGFVPGWGMFDYEEHFDAPLATSMWNIRNGYQDAQDASTMRPANVLIEDSCVKLRVKREADSGRLYTSGYIDTIGKWTRRYGRFEFRARIPTLPNISKGLWPALWLRDATGGGECDIMESIGTPNNHMDEWPASPGRYSSALYRQTGDKPSGYWGKTFSNIDVADGQFHRWAVEWTPDGFTYLCDDIVQHRIAGPAYTTTFAPGFPSAVNLRIDVFVGSNWAGFPDESQPELTELPADFEIDYFRYWEYQP